MRLILTNSEPYHANYCTEEGQVIYKVSSPFKFVKRKATIDKVLPNKAEGDMQDRFTRLATIEFNTLTSSKITMGCTTQTTSSFFRKGGLGWQGRDRIFTGPAGKEYRWVLGPLKPELYLNDESKTPVAKYHFKHYGILSGEARPASVEIFPPGEHMVDMIVITLVYIEKLRKDRERASRSGGGD